MLLVIGVIGVVLAASIAIRLYPEYPERGPHEWVAAADDPSCGGATRRGDGAVEAARDERALVEDLHVAFSVLVLGGTIALFDRTLETALPLSVARATRWQPTGIEDDSNYYLIRAEGIDVKAADRYATDLGLIESKGRLRLWFRGRVGDRGRGRVESARASQSVGPRRSLERARY